MKDSLDAAQLKAATPKWQRILALRSFGESAHRSVLDAALQFCRGTPDVSVTLLGMRVEEHLRDNQRYFGAPLLDAEQYLALRRLQ